MSTPALLRLMCATPLVLAAAFATAQTRLDKTSAEQLVAALAKPAAEEPAPAPVTRSLGRMIAKAPDAETKLCAGPGNTLPQSAAGGPTRTLYVTNAPKVDLNVRFGLDSASLTPDAEQMLNALGQALKDPQLLQYQFVIAGHTDKRGNDEYNKRLSCERALAVREYLVKRHGIERNRLVALGFGFDKLLEPNEPADEVNRRVEIRRF
jgi:outer membrane protein OmpA-like peptidoglycan-associated protein